MRAYLSRCMISMPTALIKGGGAMERQRYGKLGLTSLKYQSSVACTNTERSPKQTQDVLTWRNETMNTETIHTIKDAKKFASSIGMSINKTEYGEYRVTASRSLVPDYERREVIAYYSDDLQDALHTMQAIRMELNSKAPMVTEY